VGYTDEAVEPDRQLEIQLGHMCNNRCVFCVSGQRTELREAMPVSGDPVLERLRAARGEGIRKITLLGGEPTIQPDFLRIVRGAVDLGFEEIVIFTNGVKTARGTFVDEILETGGNFTFRLSFQGGTSRAHNRTTKKLGSFDRLVDSMKNLRARGQRITVNMCVVRSNYESVAELPTLLLPFGVSQVHLDMIRPLDAGVRTEDEMRAMLPRYSEMVPALEAMVAGFPRDFDVNIGNLPYCIAPALAPVIHHDGETTMTIAVDQRDSLSDAWNKYEVKRRDKVKPSSCRECVFDAQCSGVFETYQQFYGTEELVPVTRTRLRVVDPELRLFTLHAEPLIDALRCYEPAAPFSRPSVHVSSRDGHVTARLPRGDAADLELRVQRPGGGIASTDLFSLHVQGAVDEAALALLRGVFAVLVAASGARVHHGVGDDAAATRVDWRIGRCLQRIRGAAPYNALSWEQVTVADGGREASVSLRHDDGVGITLTFGLDGERVRSGYRLDREVINAPGTLVDGVRAVMAAVRG
jgi:MoaA/NifB/PqqE/SkfB family radical SAM enzyme